MKITTASDYAVLQAGPWEFYYGYEYGNMLNTNIEEWGFIAKKNGDIVHNFQHESEEQGTEYDLLTCIGKWIEGRA